MKRQNAPGDNGKPCKPKPFGLGRKSERRIKNPQKDTEIKLIAYAI